MPLNFGFGDVAATDVLASALTLSGKTVSHRNLLQ
jgi:hypothetical protein